MCQLRSSGSRPGARTGTARLLSLEPSTGLGIQGAQLPAPPPLSQDHCTLPAPCPSPSAATPPTCKDALGWTVGDTDRLGEAVFLRPRPACIPTPWSSSFRSAGPGRDLVLCISDKVRLCSWSKDYILGSKGSCRAVVNITCLVCGWCWRFSLSPPSSPSLSGSSRASFCPKGTRKGFLPSFHGSCLLSF